MNRRDFLLGGGLLGVVGAAIAAAKDAARPKGDVAICKGSHTPHEGFVNAPAYGMTLNSEKGVRNLIPCKRCGVLFALTAEHANGRVGIVAQGAVPTQETHSVKEWTRQSERGTSGVGITASGGFFKANS
jgi:anaerobic selenocysteine-containing dehydrogenase